MVLTGSSMKNGRQAVVIGGSIAGLLAARVLVDHFDRVILLERDRFPDGVENRKGVPQGRHAHVLLARGLEILDRLFPGLKQELVEAGAVQADAAADIIWYQSGVYKQRFISGMIGLNMSRPFLEWHIRRRVLALPKLETFQDRDVRGLLSNSDHSWIKGVRLRAHNAGDGAQEIPADLVVDASGRGSHTPKWLEALGYPRPPQTSVKAGFGYTSRIYRRRPSDLNGALVAVIFPMAPKQRRAGGAFLIEGDRWLVTLGGYLNDHAPTDEPGFLEFARSLPVQDVYNLICNAEPLSQIVAYNYPESVRRHYEKLDRFPNGLVVVGDAMCSFNPAYGQGMTVSGLEAVTLRDLLQEMEGSSNLEGLPLRFFHRVAKVIDVPWSMAIGEDFRYPQTEGPRPPGITLTNGYSSMMLRAMAHDTELYRAFLRVMNLLDPPSVLMRPGMVLRVLHQTSMHRSGGRPPSA